MLLPALLLAMPSISAQDYHTFKTAPKRALKQYERGKQMQSAQQIEEAIEYYQLAIKADETFIDAYIRLGDLFIERGEYRSALEQFERAQELDPGYSDRIGYAIGMLHYNLDDYPAAAASFRAYIGQGQSEDRIESAKKQLEKVEYAMQAVENPVPFQPQRMPSTINTLDYEYLPSFTADGQSLVFTRRGKGMRGQEDFYRSQKRDGVWQEAVPLLGINTPANEGAQTMSADGKTLIFTGCNRRDGLGSCDLYISRKKENFWTPPVNMGRGINSRHWDSHPSLSANGDILIFASNRPGGYGKSDIYISFRDLQGNWSTPENLGEVINTSDMDQFPFFHADSRTLYFVSKGHPGMGGFDIFRSRFLGAGAWSKPENLGYPINSRGDESTLIVSHDGRKGYFASNQYNYNVATTDIYEFELYEAARPEPVTYVKAQVIDAVSRAPLPNAQVELFEAAKGQVLYLKETDEEGGFLISLASGQSYGMNVEKEGYLFHSENFDLSGQRSIRDPFELVIELQPITRDLYTTPEIEAEPIVLRNVFFATGSAELLPASLTELDRLYTLLVENPSMKIRIEGHTDNVGKVEDNNQLSNDRAQAVHDYLVEKGISTERLSYRGYGESRPIATNDTPEGRQRNRRTAFVITR